MAMGLRMLKANPRLKPLSLNFFAKRLTPYVQGSLWIKIIPGLVLLALGLYAFVKYLW